MKRQWVLSSIIITLCSLGSFALLSSATPEAETGITPVQDQTDSALSDAANSKALSVIPANPLPSDKPINSNQSGGSEVVSALSQMRKKLQEDERWNSIEWFAQSPLTLILLLLAVIGNIWRIRRDRKKKSQTKASVAETSWIAAINDSIDAIIGQYPACYGREEHVEDVLNQVKTSRENSFVILAEAGMGKSAFLVEIQRKLKEQKLIFYPFRATDPILNNPLNLYRWILHKLGNDKEISGKSAEELRKQIYSHLLHSKERLYIIIDAIDEAAVALASYSHFDESAMPCLFERIDHNVDNVRLIYTIRGKKDENNDLRPVTGITCDQWFTNGQKYELPALPSEGVLSWISTVCDNEILSKAIFEKTKDSDHYPLYVEHIFKHLKKPVWKLFSKKLEPIFTRSNVNVERKLEIIRKLPRSFPEYVEIEFSKITNLPFGKWRKFIWRLACAKNQILLLEIGVKGSEDSIPWKVRRWIFLRSNGQKYSVEFSHDLYRTWLEQLTRSLPPWWLPNKALWNCRCLQIMKTFLSTQWAALQLPSWINTWRINLIGSPYERAHHWLAEQCRNSAKTAYPANQLLRHLVGCGDWRSIHTALTSLSYIQERCATSENEVYSLLDDYNLVLDFWPAYERYSPYKEYRVPKWEQKLILKALKEVDGVWPAHGSHEEISLRTRFAAISSESKIDPFGQGMEITPQSRIELYYQFVRSCSTALRHAKDCETVVAEQAYGRAKMGLVAEEATKVLEKWNEEGKPYIRYAEYSRQSHAPVRAAVIFDLFDANAAHVAIDKYGKFIISADNDVRFRVWDIESGKITHSTHQESPAQGDCEDCKCIAIGFDGRRAVSLYEDKSQNKSLNVWDSINGSSALRLSEDPNSIDFVAITPDGRHAVSRFSENCLLVWDTISGMILHRLEGAKGRVVYFALSNDEKRAVSASIIEDYYFYEEHERGEHGSRDTTLVTIWDLESSAHRIFKLATGSFNHFTINTNWTVAITTTSAYVFQVWNLETETARPFEGHTDWVNYAVVTDDGKRGVSASSDGTLIVWDLVEGIQLHVLQGHTSSVNYVALCGDERLCVSKSIHGALILWDLVSGESVEKPERHSAEVSDVKISADGKIAVSSDFDGSMIAWDSQSGNLLDTLTGHEGFVRWIWGIAISLDGRRVVSASGDHCISVWDLDDEYSGQLYEEHSSEVYDVALSLDGSRAVTIGGDNILILWDFDGDLQTQKFDVPSSCSSVKLSADGKRAVLICNAIPNSDSLNSDQIFYGIFVFNFENELFCYPDISDRLHTDVVNHYELSPDAKFAITASKDKTLIIWSLHTGKHIHHLTGHEAPVNHVVISPDGKEAVSASDDGTLIRWNVQTGKSIARLRIDFTRISPWKSVILSPDGKHAISISKYSSIVIWELSNKKSLYEFYLTNPRAIWHHSCITLVGNSGNELRFATINTRLSEYSVVTPLAEIIFDDINVFSLCLNCGNKSSVPTNALNTIKKVRNENPKAYTSSASPCKDLTHSAWEERDLLYDEAGMLHTCSKCGTAIRYNPWILGEDDDPKESV